MPAYYGPRFYRVVWTRSDGTEGNMAFGDRRSEARAHAERVALDAADGTATLESIDDRYPANVLTSELIKPRNL